jgi:hypothetical protein
MRATAGEKRQPKAAPVLLDLLAEEAPEAAA